MDVQCARAYLQEMRIRAEDPNRVVRGWNTFLVCLHAMDGPEVSAAFRSAAQHFEGQNKANLFLIGKRDIPGSWVDMDNVACVSSFVAILQFEGAMLKANFTRYLGNWLNKQRIPDQVIDKVVRQSRIFTVRECEALGLRYESPIEIDAGVRSDFERLTQLPKDEEQSREYRQLLGKCTVWMEERDLPDEFYELPPDELLEAVTRYDASGGASAPTLTDGLAIVDRNTVQVCDAAPVGPPTIYGPGGLETPILADEPDDPVDSCDELERELVANQAVAPTNSAEQFQLQRREHEPAGFALYKTVTGLPVLTTHRPKQTMSTDEVVAVLVERFRRKHGETEPTSFKGAMLQIAGCLREGVDEGRLAQKDRLSTILPLLQATFKKLFDRKAASISTELRDEISRIVLQSRCKNCGGSFVPSDQSLYDSDGAVVDKKAYNTRDFCEARCDHRWQCFRCMCGRLLQKDRMGLWLMPRCSTCGVGRPILSRSQMDNVLSGLSINHQVRQFYPRF
jgi:hypothetical protein